MSDETKERSTLFGAIGAVAAIITILFKGVGVAMDVHADVSGLRRDFINATHQLERIEQKIDRHEEDISRLKAKVGLVLNERTQTVGGGNR